MTTYNMPLMEHAEAWARENGEVVPERMTPEWDAMYARWHEYAFKDFVPKVKMPRAYAGRLLGWASGGDVLQQAGSAWYAGHEVDGWLARDVAALLWDMARTEQGASRHKRALYRLAEQLDRKIRNGR